MTKLTIQLDGKSYTTKEHTQGESTVTWYINDFIAQGQLVELQPQEEKRIPQIDHETFMKDCEETFGCKAQEENSKDIFEKLDSEMRRICLQEEKPDTQRLAEAVAKDFGQEDKPVDPTDCSGCKTEEEREEWSEIYNCSGSYKEKLSENTY